LDVKHKPNRTSLRGDFHEFPPASLYCARCHLLRLCEYAASCPREQGACKISPWKPEDVIFAENVRQFRISPDGQWVAWIKAQGDKEKMP